MRLCASSTNSNAYNTVPLVAHLEKTKPLMLPKILFLACERRVSFARRIFVLLFLFFFSFFFVLNEGAAQRVPSFLRCLGTNSEGTSKTCWPLHVLATNVEMRVSTKTASSGRSALEDMGTSVPKIFYRDGRSATVEDREQKVEKKTEEPCTKGRASSWTFRALSSTTFVGSCPYECTTSEAIRPLWSCKERGL